MHPCLEGKFHKAEARALASKYLTCFVISDLNFVAYDVIDDASSSALLVQFQLLYHHANESKLFVPIIDISMVPIHPISLQYPAKPFSFITSVPQFFHRRNAAYNAFRFFRNRGGTRTFPTGGLTLPTRGTKYGFQGTVNAKNLRQTSFSPSDGG